MRSSQQSINFYLVPSQFQSVFYHADSPPGWQSSNHLSYCFTLIPADKKSKMLSFEKILQNIIMARKKKKERENK